MQTKCRVFDSDDRSAKKDRVCLCWVVFFVLLCGFFFFFFFLACSRLNVSRFCFSPACAVAQLQTTFCILVSHHFQDPCFFEKKFFFFSFFFFSFFLFVLTNKTRKDCLPVDNSTLRYCSDPDAGLVNYTSCISPRDLTTENADIRAFNNSQSMPKFSEDGTCTRAQKRLLCALLFPKCQAGGTGAVISQPVCRTTCENFFRACNVALTTQCGLTEGIGPSATCTGFGIPTSAPAWTLLVAVVALISILF